MCGIVGRVGAAAAVEQAINGLELLEYRGYDSWGLAMLADGEIRVVKDVGSISRAHAEGAMSEAGDATLVLGHTRWATHGGVSQPNAHPHVSYDGRVAIVHNGVIENYLPLRRALEAEGVEFFSETDTEVVAHLIARELRDGEPPREAIARVVNRLDGEYGLGVLITDEPDAIYGVKHKSPLLVAFNGEEGVLASDQLAAFDVSDQHMYLEDGDIARVTRDGAEIHTIGPDGALQPVERVPVSGANGHGPTDKGGYTHYMLKEMHEVPDAARAALSLDAEQLAGAIPADRSRLVLIGSGSAFYVARIAQFFIRRLGGLQADALPSDEALEWVTFDERDAVIAVSQSGETFDALEVVREARDNGAHITSVCNVPNSSLERTAHHCLPQQSGPEICVLSTKSIVSQVVILVRVAIEQGRRNGTLDDAAYARVTESLARLPASLEKLLANSTERIAELASRTSAAEHWFFIGRGPFYPLALESALKFKEVSYRHAEGLPAGFFKHGTISLIDEDFYTVALLPSKKAAPQRFQSTISNVSEIAARNGPVIGFGPEDANEDDLVNIGDYVPLPYHDDDAADVVIQLLAGQLFAYYCALSLGREIDQPRSLAKSVTVR